MPINNCFEKVKKNVLAILKSKKLKKKNLKIKKKYC